MTDFLNVRIKQSVNGDDEPTDYMEFEVGDAHYSFEFSDKDKEFPGCYVLVMHKSWVGTEGLNLPFVDGMPDVIATREFLAQPLPV